MKDWPTTLEINAWLGDRPARSDVAPTARKLATDPARRVTGSKGKLAPKELDPANWSDTRIGWGLILHQDAAIPAPLEELLAARSGSPVLRFKPGVMTHLHNPAGPVDIPIVAGPTGTATPASLPYYLLIYGSPDLIPWAAQHVL